MTSQDSSSTRTKVPTQGKHAHSRTLRGWRQKYEVPLAMSSFNDHMKILGNMSVGINIMISGLCQTSLIQILWFYLLKILWVAYKSSDWVNKSEHYIGSVSVQTKILNGHGNI